MQNLNQLTHTVIPQPVSVNSQNSRAASDQEDARLMQRIVGGDHLAFDQLYQLYSPRVQHYLKTRIRQVELIEEIFQDVMLVVWQQASQFDTTKRLSTWVLGIARNKALMYLRRQATHASFQAPVAPEYSDENPEKLLTRRENQVQVHRALTTLTLEERKLLIQAYEHERSYREIATSIGCPINTLKARIRRLRQRLLPTLVALEAESKGTARRRKQTIAA